jgi:hypothetical protein
MLQLYFVLIKWCFDNTYLHSLALIRKLTVSTREEIVKFLNKSLINKPNTLKNHRLYTLLQNL